MSRSKQSTNLASISSSNIMELPVLVPPKNEQRAVLAHIQSVSVKVEALLHDSRQAIELLMQMRAGLVSAAVTGQIDVRGLFKAEAE
jgi:type I restriction enzyme S subunit